MDITILKVQSAKIGSLIYLNKSWYWVMKRRLDGVDVLLEHTLKPLGQVSIKTIKNTELFVIYADRFSTASSLNQYLLRK